MGVRPVLGLRAGRERQPRQSRPAPKGAEPERMAESSGVAEVGPQRAAPGASPPAGAGGGESHLQRARRLGHRVGAANLRPVGPPGRVQRKITYLERPQHLTARLSWKFRELREAGYKGLPELKWSEIQSGITALDDSPVDYGLIDLDDDQHLALLAHYLAKQAKKGKEDDKGVEHQEAEEERKDKETRERHRKSPAIGRTYRTIYLGAGASIAYHIATRSPNLKPLDSLIIGPVQPWAGTRGPGVVAHPKHMITPMRQFLGKTDEAVDDVWLDRGKFSELIADVLKKSKITHFERRVEKIEREGEFIKVEVEGFSDPYYADKVVSGIGVGDHTPRGIAKEQIAGKEGEVGGKRVMDMDLFTRVAGDLAKEDTNIKLDAENPTPGDITIILSGGNGAIDVAFDALNKGYKVHWIVGSSGPKFLPGFFNLAAYLPYLRSLKKDQLKKAGLKGDNEEQLEKARKKEIERVEKMLGPLYESQKDGHEMFEGVVERFLAQSKKFEGIHFGRMKGENVKSTDTGVTVSGFGDDITGDLLVYGLGQDNKTFKLLEGFMDDLVPQQDVSGRFGEPGKATLGLTTFDDKLEVVGATAFRLAPQVAVTKERVTKSEGELWERRSAVWAKCKDVVSIKPFNEVWSKWLAVKQDYGKAGEAAALGEFAKAAADFDAYLAKVDVKALKSEQLDAVKSFERALTKARRLAKVDMEPVINTLPDNVLINDQLTPTRSQIEATTGFVPYDIGQRANFLTDDRTALAVHIAARYSELPRFWADLMVEKIIDSRTKEVSGHAPDFSKAFGKIPPAERSVPPNGVKFQKLWEAYLGQLEIEKRKV